MESAGRLLGRVRLPHNLVTPEDIARGAWPRAVGKKIAMRTNAIALVRKRLVVEVEDPVWQRQLNALRLQILINLQKAAGEIGTTIFHPVGTCAMGAFDARGRPRSAATVLDTDCRVYRVRPDRSGCAITQLTVDQTYATLAQQPPANGSANDPARMVGAGALGIPPVQRTRLRNGDLLVGRAMGAYTWASATEFNFFPRATVVAANLVPGDPGSVLG